MCHLRNADLQPRSPLWPPVLINRRALQSATTGGDRPRHAPGAAHNQGPTCTNFRSLKDTEVMLSQLARIYEQERIEEAALTWQLLRSIFD